MYTRLFYIQKGQSQRYFAQRYFATSEKQEEKEGRERDGKRFIVINIDIDNHNRPADVPEKVSGQDGDDSPASPSGSCAGLNAVHHGLNFNRPWTTSSSNRSDLWMEQRQRGTQGLGGGRPERGKLFNLSFHFNPFAYGLPRVKMLE